MKIVEYNKDNLMEHDIDEIVTRVKVFIINEKNEILIANSNGGCQLPGGHVEDNESLTKCLLREVREETGIFLSKDEVTKPFYEIRHYTRNYKGTNQNRLSNVYYFLVKTNKEVDINNLTLTETEKKYNFNATFIPHEKFKEYVLRYANNSDKEINRIIAQEILLVFDYM